MVAGSDYTDLPSKQDINKFRLKLENFLSTH